jgi:hypothetical protein
MPERPRLLVLSFSPIASDARVLKQVRAFADRYDVTTCGFGPSPDPRVEHLELPPPPPVVPGVRTRLRGLVTEGLKTARLYRAAYWRAGYARTARRLLRSHEFDVVLANDVDTVLVALSVTRPDRLHVDLHEYWMPEGKQLAGRRALQAGYYRWLCRKIVSRAASTTTVGHGIAREYARRCGFTPGVVPNVAPFHELEPTTPGEVVRLVHAGVGAPSRGIHKLVEAATATTTPVTLDLFLVPVNAAYVETLRESAERSGGRVVLHDPVPQRELVSTLNDYDVGVYLLEPQTFNSTWALPNKIFDFVQARLGVVVGPSPEMAEMVRSHGVGTVTDGFTAADLTRVLDIVTSTDVAAWKKGSTAAAHELSAETVQHVWEHAVDAIAGSRSARVP